MLNEITELEQCVLDCFVNGTKDRINREDLIIQTKQIYHKKTNTEFDLAEYPAHWEIRGAISRATVMGYIKHYTRNGVKIYRRV